MVTTVPSREPLDRFIAAFRAMADDAGGHEPALLARGAVLMRSLIAGDPWLPPEYSHPGSRSYGSYLLYADPLDRFVVAAFAWSDGAVTPIHDHDVWGLIGVVHGCERSRRFSGRAGALVAADEELLCAGEVDAVSPSIGDIHEVRNGASATSVSIHVYGANLVTRPHRAFDAETGKSRIIFSEPFLNQSAFIAHT